MKAVPEQKDNRHNAETGQNGSSHSYLPSLAGAMVSHEAF
jgi:hypothetical protein